MPRLLHGGIFRLPWSLSNYEQPSIWLDSRVQMLSRLPMRMALLDLTDEGPDPKQYAENPVTLLTIVCQQVIGR
jgi:hypothetical protein